METQIAARFREVAGKGAAHKLREAGRIPAVIYGPGRQPRNLSVDAKEIERIMAHGQQNRLFRVNISGDGQQNEAVKVLIKDIQREPLEQKPIHLDFAMVSMDQPIEVRVPVHLTGESQRPQDGAALHMMLHEVEISCLPGAIPERINLDVSGLKIGDNLLVKDLVVPTGVSIRSHAEDPVIMATAPKQTEPEPAESEEATSGAAAKKVKEE